MYKNRQPVRKQHNIKSSFTQYSKRILHKSNKVQVAGGSKMLV